MNANDLILVKTIDAYNRLIEKNEQYDQEMLAGNFANFEYWKANEENINALFGIIAQMERRASD